MSIADMARKYMALRTEYSDLERRTKEAKQMRDEAERMLADSLIDEGMDSVKVDGRNFRLSSTTKALVNKADMDVYMERLRQRDLGDMITTSVNFNTTQAFIKSQLAENGGILPDWLEDIAHVSTEPSIILR